MEIQLRPETLINFILLFISLSILTHGISKYREQRHRSDLFAFVLFISMLVLWQLNAIFADIVTSVDLLILSGNVFNALIGPSFVYASLWFVFAYTDNEQWVNPWTKAIAAIHVVGVSVAFLFDPAFMYEFGEQTTRGPMTVLNVTFEPWVVLSREYKLPFLLYQGYSYVLVMLSGVVLARYMIRNRDEVYPGQALALALGIVIPLAANAVVLFGLLPPEDHLTDLSIGVTAIMFGIAVFRYRLLRVAPVGRRQVVETMADPVVMVNDEGWVVDANRAARELVGAGSQWRGMAVEVFFSQFPDQVARFREMSSVETEISVDIDGRTRYFDLNISPIQGPNDEQAGYVIDLREVTPLKEREQELDLMRQIQSRVLRHNIRNDLQTVRLYSEHIEDSFEGESAELARQILTTTDGLLSVSEKTRITEQLIEQDQTPVRLDLVSTFGEILEEYRATFPNVEFSLSAPEECVVETIPAMEFAFENLVENAAQHNDGATHRVDITVGTDDDGTVVTVSDDGPGIPDRELDVIRSGEETPLQHGTGVGLWVIQWVVDSAAATVEYETSGAGTVATVRFPHDPTP